MKPRVPGPEDTDVHDITIAVWDLASPQVVERPSAVKVGAKCSRGCDLSGAGVELLSETGLAVGRGTLGATPWPDTSALYWTDLDLTAPSALGQYAWTVHVWATAPASRHEGSSAALQFIVVGSPEHRVAVTVTRSDTDASLEEVHVRVGAFRAATDGAGVATIDVPAGTYEVSAWKAGYEAAVTRVECPAAWTSRSPLSPLPGPKKGIGCSSYLPVLPPGAWSAEPPRKSLCPSARMKFFPTPLAVSGSPRA